MTHCTVYGILMFRCFILATLFVCCVSCFVLELDICLFLALYELLDSRSVVLLFKLLITTSTANIDYNFNHNFQDAFQKKLITQIGKRSLKKVGGQRHSPIKIIPEIGNTPVLVGGSSKKFPIKNYCKQCFFCRKKGGDSFCAPIVP